MALLAGETVPRTIAPQSGLILAGLCCAASFAALACTVTGLLGWPV
jgi:hypothetical protein